jgi:hypothetical protein
VNTAKFIDVVERQQTLDFAVNATRRSRTTLEITRRSVRAGAAFPAEEKRAAIALARSRLAREDLKELRLELRPAGDREVGGGSIPRSPKPLQRRAVGQALHTDSHGPLSHVADAHRNYRLSTPTVLTLPTVVKPLAMVVVVVLAT